MNAPAVQTYSASSCDATHSVPTHLALTHLALTHLAPTHLAPTHLALIHVALTILRTPKLASSKLASSKLASSKLACLCWHLPELVTPEASGRSSTFTCHEGSSPCSRPARLWLFWPLRTDIIQCMNSLVIVKLLEESC